MRLFRVPLLSTYNGPSYLLHTVETLLAIGLPEANVRLVPVIAWQTTPEVTPYYTEFHVSDAALTKPESIFARFLINIRDDSRLRRFVPLIAVGMAPTHEVKRWGLEEEGSALGYRDLYSRLNDVFPEWTNRETPAERLTRQIYSQFPELRLPGSRIEAPSKQILVRSEGRWSERANPYVGRTDQRTVDAVDELQPIAELVEIFYTHTFQFLAAADAVGGMEYELQAKPEGREIGLNLSPQSDIGGLVRWLHTYPHRPLQKVQYPELDERELEQWTEYFAQCPDHDNIFVTAPALWTERDPAIVNMFEAFRDREWEDDTVTSDGMLSLAWKHLPGYIPHHPHASAITGGLNTEGILITLMETWLQDGPFLGMTLDDWGLFTEPEQIILCGLLMQRRQTVDQCELFVAALNILVSEDIVATLEAYKLEPVRLGKPFAQPGRTMSLTGVIALHAPYMLLRIPLDRTDQEESAPVEQKIGVIGRLFLPINIPLELVWDVGWMDLRAGGFLLQGDGARHEVGPASRMA